MKGDMKQHYLRSNKNYFKKHLHLDRRCKARCTKCNVLAKWKFCRCNRRIYYSDQGKLKCSDCDKYLNKCVCVFRKLYPIQYREMLI